MLFCRAPLFPPMLLLWPRLWFSCSSGTALVAQASAGREMSYVGNCLYQKRVGFMLLRPRTNAARSGDETWSLLGQVIDGRRKRLRTLLRGTTLPIGNRLYWKRVGFRLLRPRASAARSGEDTWSLLGQVVKGCRK
ncbi:hypothetical protein EDB92DRAFT_1815742 [Lactarius akahatsu]|uniref:Secreted protein n=1 Tax=Lactarius akahatsu TaxID=416441 RepID=A0AAD4LL06_9AGAM|nr:hypothetical protein EDB92DRAFT_1815742 [Lactarius akahatsu]